MTAHRRHPCGLASGNTATDHHDALGFLRRPVLLLPAQFIADDRIDRAGRRVGHGRGFRRLVYAAGAADATAYLAQAALARLVGELGVGDTGTHHANQIAKPFLDQFLGQNGIIDAAGEQHGDLALHEGEIGARRLAELAKLGVRMVRRRHIGRRSPAVTGIDVHEIEQAGLADAIEHLAHLQVVVAAVAGFLAVDAYAERHRLADTRAHALQGFDHEAGALLRTAAPFVGAPIRHRRQEAVAKGLVGAMDLDGVGARLARDRRGPGIGVEAELDLLVAHDVRRIVLRADHGHRRGGPHGIEVGQLDHHDGAALVHLGAEPRHALGKGRILVRRLVPGAAHGEPDFIRRLRREGCIQQPGLAADPAGTAARLRGMVRDEVLVDQARRHRRIGQPQPAERTLRRRRVRAGAGAAPRSPGARRRGRRGKPAEPAAPRPQLISS